MWSKPVSRIPAAFLVVVIVLGSSCAPTKVLLPANGAAHTAVELSHTPFFPQTKYHCGPAALATLLNSSGVAVDAEELANRVYLPARQGSLQIELMAASRYYERLPYVINPDLATLLTEVRAGRPVLVLLNLGWHIRPVWHYAVVVGYDSAAEAIILRSGLERRRLMPAGKFIKAWKRADNWGLLVLAPGQLPVRADETRYLQAAATLESLEAGDGTVQFFRAAVGRWPGSAVARFGLGNALYREGDLLRAEAAYREAMLLDPAMVVARNNLAHVLAERGCPGLALRELKAAADYDLPADIAEQLIQTREEVESQAKGMGGLRPSCINRGPHGVVGG